MKKGLSIFLCIVLIIVCFYNVRKNNQIPFKDKWRNQYHVTMEVFPDEHYFDANIIISVKNTSNDVWNELVLRDYPSQFKDEINGKVSQISSIYNEQDGTHLDYQREEDNTIIKILLNEPLSPGMTTTISFFYQANVPQLEARYGYVEKTAGQLDYYLGNSLPILCVYENGTWITDPYFSVGECFYSEAADYEVRVTAPLEYMIIGTGEQIKTDLTYEKRTMSYEAKAVRDFCLVLGNDYRRMSYTLDGINYASYYHSKNVDAGAQALINLTQTVEEFNDILGIYPYSTINTVETYTQMQGMEYPQLIMISEEMNGVTSTQRHEIAHQWFYNIVGNNSYQEAWLDESIATYLAEITIEGHQSKIDQNYGQYLSDEDYTYAMYFSGGSMYTALANQFGKERLNKLLYKYIVKYAYGITKTEDLLGMIIDEFGNESISILEVYFSEATINEIINK